MGIVSLNDMDNLYWTGRYGERALRAFDEYTALPHGRARLDFALRLGAGEDCADPDAFVLGAGGVVCDSVFKWRDNALQLRHLLGSQAVRQAELIALQFEEEGVYGDLYSRAYAFFGIADDEMRERAARAAVRCGRLVERLDMLSRLNKPAYELEDALNRLLVSLEDSPAAAGFISRAQLELTQGDLALGNVAAVRLRTPYMGNADELS